MPSVQSQSELFSRSTSDVDFHCHSYFSDGKLSPQELIELAEKYSVKYLSITDHDTVSAHQYLKEHPSLIENTSVKIISGIELSTRWDTSQTLLDAGQGRSLHVVGLNIDINNEVLLSHIDKTQKARDDRNQRIMSKMLKKGWDDVIALVKDETSLTRTHFANAMLKTQKVNNYSAAFRKYLGKGKPLSAQSVWPTLSETIHAIKLAGGMAVLAHPLHYKLSSKKLLQLCYEFKALGGDAIEVITGSMSKADIEHLTGLALRANLQASVGSDFHNLERFKARLGVEQDFANTLTPVWKNWVKTA